MKARLSTSALRPAVIPVALMLGGCPGQEVVDASPTDSDFLETTGGDETVDGTGSGSIDPTNAGDDGREPPPPEGELCDAGDEAWVKRAVPFIQGRKPESIREVRLLVSAVEQLDARGLDGRRLVARALAHGEVYLDRWRNYYYEQLQVQRRGDQRNSECYADLTGAGETIALAESIRSSRADDTPDFVDFTMADVLLSSLLLDDITPAYSADLFARLGTPIIGGNVTRQEIEITNRAYYGKLFESAYLGRTTECLQCHTTDFSVTDFPDPDDDRHWPVYEGHFFEKAVYGDFDMQAPVSEEDVHSIFRHSGFVDYSWCNDDDPTCNPATAVGIQAFGLDFNCGLFRTDAYEDPVIDLDGVPYMSGAFAEGAAANLFDLEPRFRDGLTALAESGVSIDDMGALDDPNVGMAFLFAMNQANEMWIEAMGYSLTVANRFPRNADQRDVLEGLTEAYFNSGYSTRTLVAEVAVHPYFNQAPPDSCGASTPYHLPAIFDPFTKSADDPQERGNGVGDMLHRYSAWVLIQSAMRSMWWDRPEQFGPTTMYARPIPFTANDPLDTGTVNAGLAAHYPIEEGPGFYAPCGAGFMPNIACEDAPENFEFLRDEGVFINPSEGGFNGVDFNGLLHWEEELASGVDPQLGGLCTGALGRGCAAEDFAQSLVDAALATSGALMWDLAVALKDRLVTEPQIADEEEIAVIEEIMGVSLDETVQSVGDADAVAAVRRYAGVLLNTPQFMLDGVPSAPQDPSGDPVVVVPGTSTQELCDHFAALTAEATAWSERSVACSDEGITVE